MYGVKHDGVCSLKKIIQDGVIWYQVEGDYFAITAHPQLFYSSYTTASWQWLELKLISEQYLTLFNHLWLRSMFHGTSFSLFLLKLLDPEDIPHGKLTEPGDSFHKCYFYPFIISLQCHGGSHVIRAPVRTTIIEN